MAFRSDITVNWPTSPRIVTVAAPSTEVSIQDLLDTLRTLEDDIANLDDKKILDAYGKIQLGPGKYTSITAVLLDALLEFEARPPGPWVLCKVTGGNLRAKDALGAMLDSPMNPTAYTYPIVADSTDGSLLEGSGYTPAQIADAVLEASVAGRPPGSLGASTVSIGQDVLDVVDQVEDVSDQVTGVAGQVADVANQVLDIADFVDDIHDEAFGKWVLNPTTATLTLYRKNGAVMQVFNLKVAAGNVPPFVERAPA